MNCNRQYLLVCPNAWQWKHCSKSSIFLGSSILSTARTWTLGSCSILRQRFSDHRLCAQAYPKLAVFWRYADIASFSGLVGIAADFAQVFEHLKNICHPWNYDRWWLGFSDLLWLVIDSISGRFRLIAALSWQYSKTIWRAGNLIPLSGFFLSWQFCRFLRKNKFLDFFFFR